MFPINLKIELENEDIKVLRKYVKTIEEPNCYVEIGTGEGGSSLIARTATDRPIYTIDKADKFILSDCGLEINFINKTSEEALKDWKEPIGVLFIDGHHNEAYQDFLFWGKYVVKGGYVLFHDYFTSGAEEYTVIKDCEPILSNPNYEKLYIPNFPTVDKTRILVIRKL